MTKHKKEKILLDLSNNKSIFDDDKNVGWGGINPERVIVLGTKMVKTLEDALNFNFLEKANHDYLKASSHFNSSKISNYTWINEHTNGNFNNEDFYLPDWNF